MIEALIVSTTVRLLDWCKACMFHVLCATLYVCVCSVVSSSSSRRSSISSWCMEGRDVASRSLVAKRPAAHSSSSLPHCRLLYFRGEDDAKLSTTRRSADIHDRLMCPPCTTQRKHVFMTACLLQLTHYRPHYVSCPSDYFLSVCSTQTTTPKTKKRRNWCERSPWHE